MCTRNTPSLTLSRQALRDAMTRSGWDTDAVFNAELALGALAPLKMPRPEDRDGHR